jgi:hypothetical protein
MKRLIQNSKYLSHGNQNELASLSLWIVCDPDTESGRQLLLDAVEFHVCSIIKEFSFIKKIKFIYRPRTATVDWLFSFNRTIQIIIYLKKQFIKLLISLIRNKQVYLLKKS